MTIFDCFAHAFVPFLIQTEHSYLLWHGLC